MRFLLYLIIVALAFNSPSWAVPPVLTYIFPAGGQVGSTVQATLNGTFPEWPPRIMIYSPDIKIEFKEKNKVSITVDPKASPGPKLFRVFNKDGTSIPKAFWVNTIPEIEEVEPNNNYLKPQMIGTGPVLINGKLATPGDTDSFAVDAKKGQTIVAHLLGNHGIESPMDAAIQILSPDGFIVAENHDRFGLDPFITFVAPNDGAYRVRIFAFPSTPDTNIRFSGVDTYIYRLTITTGPYLDHVFPMALETGKPQILHLKGWNLSKDFASVNVDVPSSLTKTRIFKKGAAGNFSVSCTSNPSFIFTKGKQSMVLDGPCTVSGSLDLEKSHDFEMKFKKGDKFKVKIEARAIGSDLDPVLVQKDGLGKEIKRTDDEGAANRDASFDVTSTGDPIFLKITDLHNHSGETYYYRMSIIPIIPDFEFSVDGESFSPKDNKPVEVPIKITRIAGHSADIFFKAIDLPKGWSAEELIVTSKTPSPVKLFIKQDEKAEVGFFKITGKSGDMLKTGSRNLPSLESTLEDYFLLTEFKEKQEIKKKK